MRLNVIGMATVRSLFMSAVVNLWIEFVCGRLWVPKAVEEVFGVSVVLNQNQVLPVGTLVTLML